MCTAVHEAQRIVSRALREIVRESSRWGPPRGGPRFPAAAPRTPLPAPCSAPPHPGPRRGRPDDEDAIFWGFFALCYSATASPDTLESRRTINQAGRLQG